MNKSQTEEAVKVMQAYVEGKSIQLKSASGVGIWGDVKHPQWSWNEVLYRIKPEPKTMYVLLRCGDDKERWGSTFNKSEAELWAERYDGHDGIIRKFVEVIED